MGLFRVAGLCRHADGFEPRLGHVRVNATDTRAPPDAHEPEPDPASMPLVAHVDRWRVTYYPQSRGYVVERRTDTRAAVELTGGWVVVDAKCPLDGPMSPGRLDVIARWWVIRSATDLELRMWEWREPVK